MVRSCKSQRKGLLGSRIGESGEGGGERGRSIEGVAKEELVTKVAKSKEGVNTEG